MFSFARDAMPPPAANSEIAVNVEKLMRGIVVVAAFLLVMAGVGARMLLWFVASAALLGALIFWPMFPGTYELAVLLLLLVEGLPLVDRRSRHRVS